jgi:hypothetical protein
MEKTILRICGSSLIGYRGGVAAGSHLLNSLIGLFISRRRFSQTATDISAFVSSFRSSFTAQF